MDRRLRSDSLPFGTVMHRRHGGGSGFARRRVVNLAAQPSPGGVVYRGLAGRTRDGSSPVVRYRAKSHRRAGQAAYSRQSEVGLIRVIDAPAYHPVRRALLINGSLQGGISLDTHEPYTDYIRQMDRAGQFYKPDARDSLILGLGAGLLARALHARGVRVTAVDIDKRVAYAARKFFDLPPEVDVRIADARSFLRADKAKYDLIFLDVFAGENLPWYLLTVEAFKEMRSHLRENGRLVINTITNASATSPALRGTVAALHAAFPDVAVFVGRQDYGQERRFLSAGEPLLVNAVVVAGEGLRDSGQNASTVFGTQDLEEVAVNEGAQAGTRVRPGTDDRSDIDYVDVSLREEWRRLTIAEFGPDILGD